MDAIHAGSVLSSTPTSLSHLQAQVVHRHDAIGVAHAQVAQLHRGIAAAAAAGTATRATRQ